ncbi:MAG: hypothetical protein ACRDIV_17895 [Ktedonobacteraceae bacterium]
MQGIPYQNIASSMFQMPQQDEDIRHYTLDLLPTGHTLTMNILLGTVSLIARDESLPYPRMIAEQQFTLSEASLLIPLLNAYPYYCPYEVMLASFDHRLITDATIERCRRRLQEAQEEGVWDSAMRPVRNVLSRTRLKMRNVGIEIASILEIGYCLMALPTRKQFGAS